MRVVAAIAVAACVAALGVVGSGTLAQTPPPPVPTVTTMPAGPVPMPTPTAPAPAPAATPPATPTGPSRAIGQPWHGRLVNGVQLPEVSADWLTWDPVLKQIPNRPERRWGTAKLIATIRPCSPPGISRIPRCRNS